MVARYGNFVTHDPPLTPLTVLLWKRRRRHCGGRVDNRRPHAPAGAPGAEPLPADTRFQARALGGRLRATVIALAVGACATPRTGSCQQVRAWQQATAQTLGCWRKALDLGGAAAE